MASVNKVILVGNLGRDPEMRYLPSGEAVANLAIATTDKYKDKTGQMVEQTEWHRVSFFGRTAEVCGQYLKKGSQVYVEGSIRTRKYTDKEGIEKYATEIRGDRMQMLGGRSGGGMADMDDGSYNQAAPASAPRSQPRSSAPAAAQRPASSGFDDMDDDIPF
ncbi:MAG: single-stranded DNA-binding protein [Thiobacillus sp.]|jgi:single-strand DNA-binding protein|uniref:single-stranded DNA-binding protein n=1 Tax=unclassified Thiobacillus TaxID=2646513 RepID=UPI0008697DC6|nr:MULTISPECIES: single-stranded DNA-binding protein [unclassified Thiobacillus]MBS0310692.1 single-stranded DNA-binding protein [Pseudomonadota bacterium]MBN8771663.1 single-stranded DNA-binding protein [Thiobacillus sp.]MBN8781312.1 single-stranded DNA-binding protein [Thiobacillus sp.]MBS0331092.1 single-stranded DNA-binding protein [Pseudomonadota bacterium]ODU99704.1 MAG: single-stranded DNA-binding protein [Thiobacillus sp. SCN 63-57]